MKAVFSLQPSLDKLGICLSVLCALHCAVLPITITLFPIIASSIIADEVVHKMLLWAVLPLGMLAFLFGCRKHKDFKILALGVLGMSGLLLSLLFGHHYWGETGEKLGTVLSGLLLALGHFKNHQLCQKAEFACHHKKS